MHEKTVNSALPEVSRRCALAAGALGVATLVFPVAMGRSAGGQRGSGRGLAAVSAEVTRRVHAGRQRKAALPQ
jgi:hypothetical protein